MKAASVVVLDVEASSPISAARRLAETTRAAATEVVEVDTVESFAGTLRSGRVRVGVIAFEALWPDPQRSLRALRDKAPGARLVVVYTEGAPRFRLGQRLWSVGLCDYFISRATPPHELSPLLGQAYADALIEGAVETTSPDDDPSLGRLYSRIRFLRALNAALTNQRRVDGLLRELHMKLPQLMDYAVLEILIVGGDAPKLHVFQAYAVEHLTVWKLAEDICATVAPFSDNPLTPEQLEFVDAALGARSDETDAGMDGGETVALPMMFCGELVGAIGVQATAASINPEQRAILQLIAYQLAASVRNAQALEAAESASLVDELTGTYNRRYLRRALPVEWRRAERYGVDLSFAIIDIDHFKRINDIHGHLVGDAVLHTFASLLRQQLRDTDHLIRYGGEEFLLILPETSSRDATLVLERIRLMLTRTPVFSNDQIGSIQITISAGVAGYPGCAVTTAEELIALADEALLLAKTSGRDRICLASAQGFDTLALEQDFPGSEKRKFSRIRAQLPVHFVELPEFEGRAFRMSATDVSSGGIAVRGPSQPLKKNAYALVYLGDEQKPRLTQVMWTRDGSDEDRMAGLQFVGAQRLAPTGGKPQRKAVAVAQNPSTRAMIQRVMNAAHYDVHILESSADVQAERLEDCTLLVLGESSLRGDLGERLQLLREERGRPRFRIALINETADRRAALETIKNQHADYLVPSESSEDALFATLSKLVLEEYFGIKKYLLWGAETVSWTLHSSAEKAAVLDGIKAMALEVRCHPRIADLLVAAVDEMIINAIYRPEPTSQETGRTTKPVTVECGSDGRFLGVAVLDEHGLFCHEDLFRGVGKALENEEKGLSEDAPHANLGFRIMLSTLSHLVINVDPGRCTEILGLVDLRKSLKEYRSAVPSLGMFTTEQREK